jgi:hypothetical protein
MEKISSTYRVTDKVLDGIDENRNILHTIKPRMVNWIGHILRRNCLLKHATEGRRKERIEVTGRRVRRRNSEEFIGTTEYLTLQASYRINPISL